MLTIPETTSYRAERDQKNPGTIRHSVIFTWQGRESDEPFPKELPLLIGGKLVRYEPKKD